MSKGKYYITTAIAYTSKVPHIGNTYEAVLTDAIARFRRAEGYDVYFLTGTDEHGQKVQDLARAAGQEPQAYVDGIAGEIRRIWDFMNVSYDQFIRTTDPAHKRAVQGCFRRLYEQGDIYKGYYEGYYCKPCESFYTETQAVGGKCPDCGAAVERAREEAYFLKLSTYAPRLLRYIEENPSFIQPESRKNEMINNFLKPGLQDLCVSRTSFTWGIPVDFDPGHVVYVWIDALSNYITALGYNPAGVSGPLFQKYWPADVHLIGKDILRFHTIYWPIMLMALGLPLPKQIFGHPWLLFGESKMSKSRGNVVYAEELVREFGTDAVRYYVLREMPFAADGNFTYELLMSRCNSDLANILGNLVSRTHAMTVKYFDGRVPAPALDEIVLLDDDLRRVAAAAVSGAKEAMAELRVADALDEIWTLLRRLNKYVDETLPWTLAKSEETRPRLGTVLYNLLEGLRIASALLAPFLPDTALRMQKQLSITDTDFDNLAFGGTVPGAALGEADTLFARIDEKAKLASLTNRLEAARQNAASGSQPPAAPAPMAEGEKSAAAEAADADDQSGAGLISIDDFAKVELRVARVTACEPVPKAKKLLKLTVDTGGESRTIVSGIAAWYGPEDLIGRQVIVVANLQPAMLRGVESRGMLLAADDPTEDGADRARVIFADGIAPGSRVR